LKYGTLFKIPKDNELGMLRKVKHYSYQNWTDSVGYTHWFMVTQCYCYCLLHAIIA